MANNGYDCTCRCGRHRAGGGFKAAFSSRNCAPADYHPYVSPNSVNSQVKGVSQCGSLKSPQTVGYPGPERPLTINEFLEYKGYELDTRQGKPIGNGHYSTVYRALQTETNKRVAIKIVDLLRVSMDYRTKFLPRELDIWKRLDHPHLLMLYKIIQHANKVYLFTEYAERGDLLTYLHNKGPQPEWKVRDWMMQLNSAVHYMHTHSIVHRDIKLENILLFNPLNVKLADFGFCREIRGEDLSRTFCGSKSYSSPEILLGRAYQPSKADIWSLGVVAYVLLANQMPFNEHVKGNDLIVEQQRQHAYRYSKRFAVSKNCRNAINAMLTCDAFTRPDIFQVMELPWFSNVNVRHVRSFHSSTGASNSEYSQYEVD